MSKKYFLYLIFIVCFSSLLNGQFSADDSAGCVPHRVKFTLDHTMYDTTTLSTVEWDFGNGTKVTSFNPPPVIYNNAGNYTVSIVINGNTGTPETKINYIKVHPIQSADFNAVLVTEPFDYAMVPTEPLVNSASTYFYQWTYYRNTTTIRSITKNVTSSNPENATDTMEFPDSNTTYLIKLRVRYIPENCVDSSTLTLFVGTIEPPPVDSTDSTEVIEEYLVPNYFAPASQVYYVVEPEDPGVVLSFQLFSRTGLLIFKTESPFVYWDGRNTSGQDCSSGVYFFVMEDISGTTGNKYKQSGFIHLFR